ncbi:MAG: transaldolase [Acidimicrobiales bacterium]|jgi:transaldolase|nr:transaldolase [Actinomycetes bacterium]MDP6105681.1 transaldolase [Acidimicrobiales bacterium]MDP7125571.1 transaldolase [Acidimicrobiales bacterium]MDP7352968.1 transaldolase [Acidimicrobiales bacterium]MDP7508377.1 transaldolase [Acidimicrobiales bacterium]|tara:strand:+ start:4391 stop:5482 length:1092 start_codon:yes stop_codon:yes gene_type:complete
MSRLRELFDQQGQSPWLDNLRRGWITSGELQALIDRGVRGITSNPSIFQKAMTGTDDYDEQLGALAGAGQSIEDSYWDLVTRDIVDALDLLRPVHEATGGLDGFVSVEVDPSLAADTAGTEDAARHLRNVIGRPNLFVKIPATAEGIPAIRTMVSEGCSVNVTLIFSLDRYQEVMEAYIGGLEDHEGDLSGISSVASFFISRTDTEIDRRLEAIGTPEALDLRGLAAVAQGQVAYDLFRRAFSGHRWEALAARGARVQRPLWASTSTKNPSYPDTLYVDALIGPDTVNTLPETTLEAFDDHGTLARTVDADPEGARSTLAAVQAVGVDLDDVSRVLEEEGVGAFVKSFVELLETLGQKADELA